MEDISSEIPAATSGEFVEIVIGGGGGVMVRGGREELEEEELFVRRCIPLDGLDGVVEEDVPAPLFWCSETSSRSLSFSPSKLCTVERSLSAKSPENLRRGRIAQKLSLRSWEV